MQTEVHTIWDKGYNLRGPYMTRVELGRARIHVFHRPDADPDMHDHPGDFVTFPLVSYVEEIQHPWSRGHMKRRLVRAFRPHFRRAELAHRVLGAWNGEWHDGEPVADRRKQVATLVWKGRNRREWGFHTPNGWVPWQEYVSP